MEAPVDAICEKDPHSHLILTSHGGRGEDFSGPYYRSVHPTHEDSVLMAYHCHGN